MSISISYKGVKVRLMIGVFTSLTLYFSANAQVSYPKRAGGALGEGPKVGSFSGLGTLGTVEYSTGTLKVNVPLYEIKVHDIKVPISISYSALGIKVGQEAGAPGMGWELNAGGNLTTRINGLNDNDGWSSQIKSTSNILLDPDNNTNHRNLLGLAMDGRADYAWDTYSYTVPSGSGRFTASGLTFPYDPTVKIDFQYKRITTGNGLIHDFTGGDDILTIKSKSYDVNSSGSSNLRPLIGAEKWNDRQSSTPEMGLARIISQKFRDTVKFEYETLSSVSSSTGIPAKTRITTTESMGLNKKIALNSNGTLSNVDGAYYFMQEPVVNQTKIEVLNHRRLKAITYATGKVLFNYRNVDVLGRDVLTSVTIYQKYGSTYNILKKYNFNYDDDMQYGHYLQSIDVKDTRDLQAGKFKFNYYGSNSNYTVGKLPVIPSSQSKAQDRWGFFNGETSNRTLLENPDSLLNLRDIPHMLACYWNYPGNSPSSFGFHRGEASEYYYPDNQNATNVAFAKRFSVFSEAIKGTLKSVTTPTGETAVYEYESNRFRVQGWSVSGPNTYSTYYKQYSGGGIRIKSILIRDGIAFSGKTLSKKTYTYGVGGPNYTSSNQVGYGLVNFPGVITSSWYKYAYGQSTLSTENLIYYSHPLNDLSLVEGSFAFYPSVIETVYKGPSPAGETVYYYDPSGVELGPWNYITPSAIAQLNMPEFYTNQGIKSARLGNKPIAIVEYSIAQNMGGKIKETINNYDLFSAPNSYSSLYSYFGGVKGMLIGTYSSSFGMCTFGGGATGVIECTTIATIPNLDPSGYKEIAPESSGNWFTGKYYGNSLDLKSLSKIYSLTSTKTTTFDMDGIDPLVQTKKYYYDNISHLLPTRIVTLNSVGDSLMTRLKYPQDFLNNTIAGVDHLRGANILWDPVEDVTAVRKAGVYQILSATKKFYNNSNGLVSNSSTYRLNTNSILTPLSSYSEVDSRFVIENNYHSYDEMGNLILYSNTGGPRTAILWGYNQQYPIAEVTNCSSINDIAYANFESENLQVYKGNWNYAGLPILDASSPGKDKVYPLSAGSINKVFNQPGIKYLLGYWYKQGSSIIVSGGTIGSEQIKSTKSNWLYVEREIISSGSLTITGNGFIDEVRLNPTGSIMSTYNYSPSVGLTRSQDSRGSFMSFEYDPEQRIKYIRDQNDNITKAYDYHLSNFYMY